MNIEELISLLPKKFQLGLSAPKQWLLMDYATTTRYPGDYEDISLSEARKAVAVARRIRKKIRELLPKEVLRNAQRDKKIMLQSDSGLP